MNDESRLTITYRSLMESEITRELFSAFQRRQEVTRVWRKRDGAWVIEDDPFVDDWSAAEYAELVTDLRRTARDGGMVLAAFTQAGLKGFASVEPDFFGTSCRYADLSSLHVSGELRGQGVGSKLFRGAQAWAKEKGADKLYISAHSAVETQAFYHAMGCVEAQEYNRMHAEKEPCDCQMECRV